MVALLHGIVLFDIPALPLFTYVKGNSPFRIRFQRDSISLLISPGFSVDVMYVTAVGRHYLLDTTIGRLEEDAR